jgi:hypothetical protein
MEINITSFFENADPFEFSASICERGKNAGPETWANAKEEGARSPLLTTPEQIQALRDHIKGFGAWDEEEIAAWTDVECNALFIQLISGNMRESGLDVDPDEVDWDEYEKGANEGKYSGNIYRGTGGQIYYYLGD